MHCKTEGIVLKQNKFTDNKRIVTIFTKSSGKKNFLIHHSSGSKNNRINIFQPFFILNLEFIEKQNSNLLNLKEFSIQTPLKTIAFDLNKTSVVFFLTEVLYKILDENYIDTRTFDFIKNSILILDNIDKTANFHISFLSSISSYLGILPKKNFSDENKFFDIREGFFVPINDKKYCMDELTSSKFNEILSAGMNDFENVKMNQSNRKILLEKILEFYSFHFTHLQNLKSIEVLNEIFKQ